jgi:HSP90 family molecular chaperone
MCHFVQAADSVEVARAAPFVEKLVADGYEVLYLTEAIDEAVVTNLAKFGELDLVDVTKEGLDVGEDAGKKVRVRSSCSLCLCLNSGVVVQCLLATCCSKGCIIRGS